MNPPDSFEKLRLAATRDFAHTMIVVDDEAWEMPPFGEEPGPGLQAPRRGLATSVTQREAFRVRHYLDAAKLVDAAMSLGLVCSVIRPPKGAGIRARVREAARRADIICLDWEVHDDSGKSALAIIKQIAKQDERQNGRLRLIAIYTGNNNSAQILKEVFDTLPNAYKSRHALKIHPGFIESEHGLRVVCLIKAHGVKLPKNQKKWQVSERDLPARLQGEFAALASGLLSTVALATIASIRDSTHHVLAKIAERLDGPYFHHRALQPIAGDAEDYGVEVVLSELKSAIDKKGVARKYAGREAISARIQEIAKGSTKLTLHYETGGKAKIFEIPVEDVVRLIVEGFATVHGGIGGERPPIKVFKKELSSIFAEDRISAHSAMRQFAVMTGVRSHPGSHLIKSGATIPQLGLGTILQDEKDEYFLCLQASCDCVRLKEDTPFLFVPLLPTSEESSDHYIPAVDRDGKIESIGLSVPKVPYAVTRSIIFPPDKTKEAVLAVTREGRPELTFVSSGGEIFKWVADLKQRRALRTAQKLGQSMGRMGFDEFEPFRSSND